MITEQHLARIMPRMPAWKRATFLPLLNRTMQRFGITTVNRVAAFLAQLAHESGEFRYMEEIWGPTAAQKRYEPKSTLATRLGNTQPGDGKRFKGRGPIQLTGRDNYRRYGEKLGLDLVGQPQLAAEPQHGLDVAGLYWSSHGLNQIADKGPFDKITRRINGGLNGAAERRRYYTRAQEVLAGALPDEPPAESAPPARAQALPRGAEAIREETSGADTPDPSVFERPELDARPDTLDLRDRMFVPTLIEVPTHVPLEDYLRYEVPVLDQGKEGACTGFGLATVANYLLLRRRVVPDNVPVSPQMIYHLARRYDEWPGEDYSGSSARGAVKAWHKHGICSHETWCSQNKRRGAPVLTEHLTSEARKRPLGAYFRVNHKDLVAMHSAIAEVGILYATSLVHEGWMNVGRDGLVEYRGETVGAHAFAIVAYDEQGFWFQNSWGPGWGAGGFGQISYDDWLENGTDVWVTRLGAPVLLRAAQSMATAHAATAAESQAYSYADLRPHIVSIGNDGRLRPGGEYGTTAAELAHVFEQDIPRVIKDWDTPRLLLYAHGGLVSESAAVQRVAEYRPALLKNEVYPLAFIWKTDYWTTLTNMLKDVMRRRRPEGPLDAALDFMLDRIDDFIEPLAGVLTGKAQWNEMKENAMLASASGGAAKAVIDHIAALKKTHPNLEIHLVGHSAGSILLGAMLPLLKSKRLGAASCTLWAPACTAAFFNRHYLPALTGAQKTIDRFAIFALLDRIERDDHCARIYNKSLLYLVSHAFEDSPRTPLNRRGTPILGMARTLDGELAETLQSIGADVVYTPNTDPMGSTTASRARHHGDFDDDDETVAATLARILVTPAGKKKGKAAAPTQMPVGGFDFHRSKSSLRRQRDAIEGATDS